MHNITHSYGRARVF